jgi:hypothetical protein
MQLPTWIHLLCGMYASAGNVTRCFSTTQATHAQASNHKCCHHQHPAVTTNTQQGCRHIHKG